MNVVQLGDRTSEFEVRMNGYAISQALRYVYIDRSFSGAPFYVGIGSYQRLHTKRRSTYHTNVAKKLKFWYREVVECSDFDSCKELESFLISALGRRDNSTGILVNHTDGGDGVLGRVVSEQERLNNPAKKTENRAASRLRMTLSNPMKRPSVAKKVSEKLQGRAILRSTLDKLIAANKGRVVSEETKLKISNAQRGVPKPSSQGDRNCMKRSEIRLKTSVTQKGKVLSEAHMAALQGSHTGHKWVVNLSDGSTLQRAAALAEVMVASGQYKYGRLL